MKGALFILKRCQVPVVTVVCVIQPKLETPSKGKKRPQLDLDTEDDKDTTLFKRKKGDRPEVSQVLESS